MILGHNDHQVGENRGFVQKFCVKGNLEVMWGHCSNTLTMLCLHNLILMKLGWRDPWPDVLLGVFRNFWSKVIFGSFRVTFERSNFKQPCTTELTMVCQCVGLDQPSKSAWWPFHQTCGLWVKGRESSNLVLCGVKCWITLYKKSFEVTLSICWF